MSENIRHLRNTNLAPELAYQLTRIISAYRPHDEPPSKEQLGERIVREESTLEEIQRLSHRRSYYRQQYIQRENNKRKEMLTQGRDSVDNEG